MSKEKEEWRDIKDFEGLYQVSDWGRVRSLDRIINAKDGRCIRFKGRVLKSGVNTGGYGFVLLGAGHPRMIHRLVAEAFIPNPDNKPEVDHIIPISEGGTDVVFNLRWATAKENASNPLSYVKRYRKLSEETKKKISEARKDKKSVIQYTFDGKIVSKYESINEAAKSVNTSVTNISRCCHKKMNSSGGFKWKFAST